MYVDDEIGRDNSNFQKWLHEGVIGIGSLRVYGSMLKVVPIVK